MSEEEIEAIETLKVLIGLEEYNKLSYKENQAIETVLKLVDKQQKEIEELKKPKYIINCETGTVTPIHNNFISKDKIREKIKQFQDLKKLILKTESETKRKSITYDLIRNDYCEQMLKELLEE